MKSDFQLLHLDPTWTLALVRAGDAFRYQHVVQSHQLGVGGVLRVKVAVTEKKTFVFESESARSKWKKYSIMQDLGLHAGT